jgi:DNA-binding transcriptional ArsR family regulator
MSDSDPRGRYLEAKNWPDNHVELSRDSLAWLARTRQDADNVLYLRQVREDHPDLLASIWRAVSDDTSRKVLMVVCAEDGATYDDLREWVPRAGYRTLKRKVGVLRDADVIDTKGRPAVHHFASPAAELLAEDVLALVD